jgi:ribosomal protein L11 methyltransferase
VAWLAIEVVVDEAQAEALSDSLLEAGAESVALEDAEPGTEAEAPHYDEPGWGTRRAWRRTRLVALAHSGTDPAALLARAAGASGLKPPASLRVARVENEDWVRRTQSQFGPIQVAERLWIVPSWCASPAPGALCVRLDPGLAFGTGSHPSTRLVLRWLARELRGGERVLDYGCGSGILAIAAAKLGAGEVTALDVDPQALQAASVNARANAVSVLLARPESLPAVEYDIVLANILAGPLVALAPSLARLTRRGGRIALSGVLERQAPELLQAYRPLFDAALGELEDGWALFEGRRRAQ